MIETEPASDKSPNYTSSFMRKDQCRNRSIRYMLSCNIWETFWDPQWTWCFVEVVYYVKEPLKQVISSYQVYFSAFWEMCKMQGKPIRLNAWNCQVDFQTHRLLWKQSVGDYSILKLVYELIGWWWEFILSTYMSPLSIRQRLLKSWGTVDTELGER